MKNVPNKIYLQVGELTDEEMGDVFDDLSEVTWCKDKIFPTDIEFCRSGQETLSIGKYLIPEGCKATVMGGEVIISIKKDNRIKEGDWRCKDCIHRKKGKASINAWSMSWVCELKPKTVRNPRFANQKLFYCANRNDKACEKFERKEDEK